MRHEPCLDKQSFPKLNLLVFGLRTSFPVTGADPEHRIVCRRNADGAQEHPLTANSVRRQLSFRVKPSTSLPKPKAAGTVWRIAASDSNTKGR
jgi:hypothetical protein